MGKTLSQIKNKKTQEEREGGREDQSEEGGGRE